MQAWNSGDEQAACQENDCHFAATPHACRPLFWQLPCYCSEYIRCRNEWLLMKYCVHYVEVDASHMCTCDINKPSAADLLYSSLGCRFVHNSVARHTNLCMTLVARNLPCMQHHFHSVTAAAISCFLHQRLRLGDCRYGRSQSAKLAFQYMYVFPGG